MISFDINQKKWVNLLYKEILEITKNKSTEFLELSNKIINYISILENESIYDFNYDLEISVESLLNSLHVKFNVINNDIFDKIIDLISIISKSQSIKYMAIINMNSYFSKDEIDLIENESRVKGLKIINISSNLKNLESKSYIIGSDYCIIKS